MHKITPLLLSFQKVLTILFVTVTIITANSYCYGKPSSQPENENLPTLSLQLKEKVSQDYCSFEQLIHNPEFHTLREDSCYFRNHTPIDFLNDLRLHPSEPLMVMNTPDNWITYNDAEHLIQFVTIDEPATPVISPLSSCWLPNQTSTVGNEALFLLKGYRTGFYPPDLSSLQVFTTNRTETKAWWEQYGKYKFPDESDAIRRVQNENPEFRDYPSEKFPQKSIKTKQAKDGWYVAFIIEGSGVPIISARCYYVGNDWKTKISGAVNNSTFIQISKFSPELCGCQS